MLKRLRARVQLFVGPLLQNGSEKLAKSRGDKVERPDLGRLLQMLESGEKEIDVARVG